jgi:hypothetical protein
MDQLNGSTLVGYACFIMIILIFAGPILFFVFFSIKKHRDEIKTERAELKKNQDSIRDHGGVLASGVIVAARRVKSWGGRKDRSNDSHIMEYEVDVTPENGLLFRTSFRDELYSRSYTMIGDEMITEHGRKIWVMYDLNDTSRAFLDHYDEKHEEAVLNHRRDDFNKLTEGNEDLKKTGEPGMAEITNVEDLDLPYPLKQSRAMRLQLNVTPNSGYSFQAEANILLGDGAQQKYSVGKKVYVRFDPKYPEKAVLDSERNKSLK